MSILRPAILAAVLAMPMSALPALADTPADVLVVAQNIDDIVAIDPAQAYEFTSGELVTNVYDRLVQYDAADTTVLAAGLAESWEIDAEGKTITFTLRDGATFHSGNPVRPEDVVFSLSRVVKLNLTPAFILTQLGWTPENVDEMVTAGEGNTVTIRYAGDFSPAFVMNVLDNDLESANGTVLNGQALTGKVPMTLSHGDVLEIGPFRLTYEQIPIARPVAAPEPPPEPPKKEVEPKVKVE